MPPAVEIEVQSPQEGTELVQCLWRHGLPAGLIQSAGELRVAVRSPREEAPRLLGDLYDALESWYPGRGSWLTFREPSAQETH
jgi:hypothetical protein